MATWYGNLVHTFIAALSYHIQTVLYALPINMRLMGSLFLALSASKPENPKIAARCRFDYSSRVSMINAGSASKYRGE